MPLGSANGSAILHEEEVVEIRQRYLTGDWSFGELAERYRVPKATISAVLTGTNWAHLLSEGEAEQLREMREERSTHRPRRKLSYGC